jgi:hypothetical protein
VICYTHALTLDAAVKEFNEEGKVVSWFSLYLEEQTPPVKIDEDEMLFKCMRKFPHGATLLKLLLDKGVPASAMTMHSLCSGWKPEACTALIWALFTNVRIDNDVILALIKQGGKAGLL